ncbi:hypothetical protein [Dactylococcopsis salina]|uniref:hypothetical protein n=1 Tax=Dactylococcopsis salina TaxID=292566 RepID=UPI0012EA284C|nr:hypothetical protein [Dactylococcopsis salina]
MTKLRRFRYDAENHNRRGCSVWRFISDTVTLMLPFPTQKNPDFFQTQLTPIFHRKI